MQRGEAFVSSRGLRGNSNNSRSKGGLQLYTPEKFASRVAIQGTRGYIPSEALDSVERAIEAAGDNTGNMIFQRAACSCIEASILTCGPACDVEGCIEPIREDCQAIVFPAANIIDERVDMGRLANYFINLTHPIVVLGIGTQAADNSEKELRSLHASLSRNAGFNELMRVMGEDRIRVGVRGAFTRDLLALSNVNSGIIGCPSLLLNESNQLGDSLEIKLNTVKAKIAKGTPITLGATAASPWETNLVNIELKLINSLKRHEGIYIQQSGGEKSFCLAAPELFSDCSRTQMVGWLEERIRSGMELSELDDFCRKHLRIYFDTWEWQSALMLCDIVIGTRYHGAALAMQSGTPAVVIAHDSRTAELCNATGIPHVSCSSADDVDDILDLIDGVQFNGEEYDSNRREKSRLVAKLIAECGIRPARKLQTLAHEAKL